MSHATNTATTLTTDATTLTTEEGEQVDPRTGEILPPPPDVTAVADQLVATAREQGIDLTGPNGLLTGLTRQVLQSALEAELRAAWALRRPRGNPTRVRDADHEVRFPSRHSASHLPTPPGPASGRSTAEGSLAGASSLRAPRCRPRARDRAPGLESPKGLGDGPSRRLSALPVHRRPAAGRGRPAAESRLPAGAPRTREGPQGRVHRAADWAEPGLAARLLRIRDRSRRHLAGRRGDRPTGPNTSSPGTGHRPRTSTTRFRPSSSPSPKRNVSSATPRCWSTRQTRTPARSSRSRS